MEDRPQHRKSKVQHGLIPGISFPLIIFMILYLVQRNDIGFVDYMKGMWQIQALFKLVSLCVAPNLFLFLNFYKQKKDMAARGVLMATFIYAFLLVISMAI